MSIFTRYAISNPLDIPLDTKVELKDPKVVSFETCRKLAENGPEIPRGVVYTIVAIRNEFNQVIMSHLTDTLFSPCWGTTVSKEPIMSFEELRNQFPNAHVIFEAIASCCTFHETGIIRVDLNDRTSMSFNKDQLAEIDRPSFITPFIKADRSVKDDVIEALRHLTSNCIPPRVSAQKVSE